MVNDLEWSPSGDQDTCPHLLSLPSRNFPILSLSAVSEDRIMVNSLDEAELLRQMCCSGDFVSEQDTTTSAVWTCRAGWNSFSKGQVLWVVFTALHSPIRLVCLSFSICYILAVEQIFFDYKNEIMRFFASAVGKALARHRVLPHLVLTIAEKQISSTDEGVKFWDTSRSNGVAPKPMLLHHIILPSDSEAAISLCPVIYLFFPRCNFLLFHLAFLILRAWLCKFCIWECGIFFKYFGSHCQRAVWLQSVGFQWPLRNISIPLHFNCTLNI